MAGTNSLFLIFAAASVNLLGYAIGNGYSWASPVLPKFHSNSTDDYPFSKPVTVNEESWLVALISFGSTFGSVVGGTLADKIGRKKSLMIFAFEILATYLLIAFGTVVEMYLVARFIIGLACGGTFVVLPMYIGEIAENENRGFLSCLMGVFLTLGSLVNYSVGPYVSIQNLSYISIIPIVLFYILVGIFVPESPYYYVAIENSNCAEESLMKLRKKCKQEVQKELLEIIQEVEQNKKKAGGFKDLFSSSGLKKALIISCGIMIFQQFTIITAILSYMQIIFDATGTAIPADLATIAVGLVQFLTTILTCQLVDRLGRKILLIASSVGCVISLTSLGIFFHLKNTGFEIENITWLPISSLIVFIIFYSIGLGPIPWTLMGELFPSNIKALASSITTFTCLFVAFIISFIFPYLIVIFGMPVTFWLFSVGCALGIVFIILLLPETKGKSFQEIQNMLTKEHIHKKDNKGIFINHRKSMY